MTVPLVELRGVSRTYKRGPQVVHALRDVRVAIEPGSFVVITGPSGSGKSTLLHVMAGLDRPDAGDVELEGTPIAKMSDDDLTLYRRRRLGFVFQFFHLLPTLDAADNAALPLLLDGRSPAGARKEATATLDMLGLGERATHRPRELSGGEQQRVAIARALVSEPGLLLADEPTGNLDSAAGAEVYDLLRTLPERFGTTIVMVTHDSAAIELGSRAMHLRDGALHETDTPDRRHDDP